MGENDLLNRDRGVRSEGRKRIRSMGVLDGTSGTSADVPGRRS